jgi:hypothetical protein
MPFKTGQLPMSTDLRAFIDRVIVPALLERFLREHATAQQNPMPARPAA